MKNIKVKLKKASSGFDADGIYEATEHDAGYWVMNRGVGRLIPKTDVEVVNEN